MIFFSINDLHESHTIFSRESHADKTFSLRSGGFGRPSGKGSGKNGHSGGPGDRHAHNVMSESNNRKQLPLDLEKLEKTKSKQEEKLDKAMKKLFKKNNELYEKWKTLKMAQLQKLFPPFRPSP